MDTGTFSVGMPAPGATMGRTKDSATRGTGERAWAFCVGQHVRVDSHSLRPSKSTPGHVPIEMRAHVHRERRAQSHSEQSELKTTRMARV